MAACAGSLRAQARSQDARWCNTPRAAQATRREWSSAHANLLANIRAMGRAAGPADVFVSWLPLYHDMGLIGAWLGSLYFAPPLYRHVAADFLARPEAGSGRSTATVDAVPRRRISPSRCVCASLRMPPWPGSTFPRCEVANGSEPVSVRHARASRNGSPLWLRPRRMRPSTAWPKTHSEWRSRRWQRAVVDRVDRAGLRRGVRRASGSGRPTRCSCELRRASARTRAPRRRRDRRAGERHEGRMQFRGPSATSGYFANEANRAACSTATGSTAVTSATSRRRGLRHRTRQGRHHSRRPAHLPPGSRNRNRRYRRHPQGLCRCVRRG